MFTFLVVLTIILAVLFTVKNIQLIFLVAKLGFKVEIVLFIVVEALVVVPFVFTTVGNKYTTSILVLMSIVLGIFLPALFNSTKKKHNPKKAKNKPKHMSQSEWLWLDYTTSPTRKGSKDSDSGGGFWGGGSSGGDCGSDGGGGDGGGGCD
jgi:uncharacterized membrane protein YgcG